MLALRIVRVESQPIDLLLTDVVMPLMNGRELVAQVHTIRPALKFLYMSAFSTETVEDYGIRLVPGEPFVIKPFTMESLISAVRSVLDHPSPFGRRPAP